MDMSHGAKLWQLHIGLRRTGLLALVDLLSIPQKMREIERKYLFPVINGSVDNAMTSLFALIGSYVTSHRLNISMTTFVGIDEYWIFIVRRGEFHFRYRSGANRPPQLSVKYRLSRLSNTVRGELNLGIDMTDPDIVQGFMKVVETLARVKPIRFTIQQSGNIWTLQEPDRDRAIEIVAYKVHRFEPSEIDGAFAEIEAVHFPTAEAAIDRIAHYERAFKLRSYECKQSIAELFRPGNEKLLKKLLAGQVKA